MFEQILVPLDGSPCAEQALPVAARIARASGGSLLLLQVVSLGIEYDGGLAPTSLVTEQSVEIEMAQSTNYLRSVAESSLLMGIPTTTEVLFGLPAQYILTTAEARDINLIVLCSHGRTGFSRWALGSVAHTLAHESMVPILVLRESEHASLLLNTETARPLCALVPLDGSRLAEAALVPAAHLVTALAAPALGALHLAQVVKLVQTMAEEGFISELNEEVRQHARAYLAQVTEGFQKTRKDLNLSLTSSVELGKDVSTSLLHLEKHGDEGRGTEGSCDLIAISTHGRGGLERWVMGSVTDRLLTNTKLPMLIVRPQKTSKDEFEREKQRILQANQ